ncbi:MAG TPA: LysM peptidoglycan-binding domain-containing protein, partial [Gemmatimonadales bacterium]|nr:LysM peptidoglycan-binding domain-containing protein [Gemmatimonadales bacterium]
ARATGMWQFMRGTARAYGLRVDSWVDERRDPYKATEAAAQYLSDLYKQFGSLYLAAAAYNAGGGSISRSIRRMPDDDADTVITDATFFRLYDTRLLHRETADYVPKLIAAALIAKQPEQYGFTVPDSLGPVSYDSLVVPGMVGLDVLAKLAHVTVSSLRELNPQYIKLVTPPDGKSVVRLPAGTGEIAAAAFAKLPASQRVSFVHYTVRRGESISVIAHHFHISQRELLAANPRVKPRRLQIGQHLIIPTGSGAAALVARRQMEESEPVRSGQEFHTVRRGESVSVIAQRYEVSEKSIRSWNHLDRKGTIRIGQRLRISPPSGRAERGTRPARNSVRTRTHIVKRGETLTGLARRYGVSLQALKEANGLHGNDPMIRAGSSLRIPTG